MYKRLLVLMVLALTITSTIPAYAFSFGNSNTEQLLYVKHHFNAVWYFYNDKVVVSYEGENITLYNIIGSTLGYSLLEANKTHVVLYSNVTLGNYYITLVFDYRFSPFIPQAKYSAYIVSNLNIPSWLGYALSIKAVFPSQPWEHNHTWRAKYPKRN